MNKICAVHQAAQRILQLRLQIGSLNWQRLRLYSSGIDEFLAFERELAKKRRLEAVKVTSSSNVVTALSPPNEPSAGDCCGRDCPNCVWLLYQEELLDFEALTNTSSVADQIQKAKTKINDRITSEKKQDRLMARVMHNQELCLQNKFRTFGSIRAIEFDTGAIAGKYSTADNLAVYAPNSQSHIMRFASALNINLNDQAEIPITESHKIVGHETIDIQTALKTRYDLTSVPHRRVLAELSQVAANPEEASELCALSSYGSKSYREQVFNRRLSIVDIAERFPSARPQLKDWWTILEPQLPRYYTISSSPLTSPDRLTIIVRVVQEELEDYCYQGVCSNFLASLRLGDLVNVGLRKSCFALPENDSPVIMIGPGTGIAPFLGFLDEAKYRRSIGARVGPLALFCGCRSPVGDFIFGDELNEHVASGNLEHLFVAFSRLEKHKKVYVQDLVRENANLIWDYLIKKNGSIFVCGSTAMGNEVRETLKDIVMALGNHSEVEAIQVLKQLQDSGNYRWELWS